MWNTFRRMVEGANRACSADEEESYLACPAVAGALNALHYGRSDKYLSVWIQG